MVADPVTGAEVLMGGIVEHAPADAAHMLTIRRSVILDPGMAQGMLLPPLPGVKGLGGEHVAVMLRDNQCFPAVRGGFLPNPARSRHSFPAVPDRF